MANIQTIRQNKYITKFINSGFYQNNKDNFIGLKPEIQIYKKKKSNFTYELLQIPKIIYNLRFLNNGTTCLLEINKYVFDYLHKEFNLNINYDNIKSVFSDYRNKNYYDSHLKHQEYLRHDEKMKLKQIELYLNNQFEELLKHIIEEKKQYIINN